MEVVQVMERRDGKSSLMLIGESEKEEWMESTGEAVKLETVGWKEPDIELNT